MCRPTLCSIAFDHGPVLCCIAQDHGPGLRGIAQYHDPALCDKALDLLSAEFLDRDDYVWSRAMLRSAGQNCIALD
jgi:hypothetical protein